MKPYTYLIINVACIAIPFFASFYKKYPFYKEWKHFLSANFIVSSIFILWDIYFTKLQIWGFNSEYLLGINIFNLPVEEILFFICIPYACVFTYFVFKKYLSTNIFSKKNYSVLINVLILLMVISSLFFFNKMYTFYTSIFLLLTLLFVKFKRINISVIIISYLAIIPFFFISNGILTGSIIDNPIVWYDDSQNLSFRLFTIPIEDAFYGFLLITLNCILFDYLKHKSLKEKI